MINHLKRKLPYLVYVLFLAAVLPGTALAQGSDPTDDDVNAIARELYCPVCENIPLDACGTAACEQWRGIIRDKLTEGWSGDQIKDYFVNQYGDRVLAEPPRRGFNWVAYIVPLVIFGGGGVLLFRGFQQWRPDGQERRTRNGADNTAQMKKPSPEDIRRVEEELRKRSGGD